MNRKFQSITVANGGEQNADHLIAIASDGTAWVGQVTHFDGNGKTYEVKEWRPLLALPSSKVSALRPGEFQTDVR